MAELHLPDNIKVHFAGCEVQRQFIAPKFLGVNYGLYTCYPFVERMVFGKGNSPIIPLDWQKDDPFHKIPTHIIKSMKHVIQDSGLFTLMFGSQKGKKDEAMINKWYDKMVEFTLENGQGATCVEVDCQKVLGVEKAWEFRERIKRDLSNRIINVFHLEDGKYGLDRLIEFSDYIAISVPELRFAGKKDFVYPLARYIKVRKPNIDIHLLGCTELEILRKCRFCTSSDSTSWIAGKRYGFIDKHHISSIYTNKCRELVGGAIYDEIMKYNNETNTNFLVLIVEKLKRKYQDVCGNQDYYKK